MSQVTGQTVVTNALVTIGVYGMGEIPSVSDSNDALAELNDMWEAWGVDEGLIFAVQKQVFAWPLNVASNPIGTTATAPFNVALPTRLYAAYWIPMSGPRVPLRLVNSTTYYEHRDLSASSALSPDELYADWLVSQSGNNSNLSLWPVPAAAGSLEIDTGAPFSTWTLNGVYALPLGYQDAINYVLASRLIPRYGVVVNEQIAARVDEKAQGAEDRIRQMNLVNRQMKPGSEVNPVMAETKDEQPARA